jgi:flagellar biosynthetic protein FlhB
VAEQADSQERTERATPKRLQEARDKGQVARSRELTTTLVLFGGAAALYLSGDHLLGGIAHLMQQSFALSHAEVFAGDLVQRRLAGLMLEGLVALTPLLVAATAIALAAPLLVGGWSLSPAAMLPKFERLDPVAGMRRIFSLRGLTEMLKAFAKFCLILGFSLAALSIHQDAIMGLARGTVAGSLAASSDILWAIFLLVAAATIVIALCDVPLQLWQHARQLRMSRQELREEMKETDGSPELRGRVRQMQQEIARRRMMQEVPKADVVITNPEHYAVALKFDPATMRAPLVVAKGVEEIARHIREVAAAHGVTMVSAPPLARAIYHTTKLGREIPAGLYLAVARVLAYVFQLRAGTVAVTPPDDLPIPADLSY